MRLIALVSWCLYSEPVVRRLSIKKVLQKTRKRHVSHLFLNKVAGVLDIFQEMLRSFSEGLFCRILVNDCFSTCRGSRSEMFCRKGVFKNFAKFTVKQLYPQPATLLEKRLWHRCFPAKLFKSTVFIEHL